MSLICEVDIRGNSLSEALIQSMREFEVRGSVSYKTIDGMTSHLSHIKSITLNHSKIHQAVLSNGNWVSSNELKMPQMVNSQEAGLERSKHLQQQWEQGAIEHDGPSNLNWKESFCCCADFVAFLISMASVCLSNAQSCMIPLPWCNKTPIAHE